MSNENFDRQLDGLLASYRDACPDVEPSTNFMPNLWRRIEARQPLPFHLLRLTRVFVSGAAAMCLLMGGLLFLPSAGHTWLTYIDILDNDQPTEVMAYADLDDQAEWQ